MLAAYQEHVQKRLAEGIPPKPLNAEQVTELVQMLKSPGKHDPKLLLHLFRDRIPPGVDEAAYVKAAFLSALLKGSEQSPLIDAADAIQLLGNMYGGYNIAILLDELENADARLAALAAEQLKHSILIFDAIYDLEKKMLAGNQYARSIIESWADAEWFLSQPPIEDLIHAFVFKVPGETNTDDISPAPEAWSRPDIPLHANSFYKMPRDGLSDPIQTIQSLRKQGTVAFSGDVLGTGSSRKSAVNSVLWHIGRKKVGLPNKHFGGICIADTFAPIFRNTLQDSGTLVIECPVNKLHMGQQIEILPREGLIRDYKTQDQLAEFHLHPSRLDEIRAGGRIYLIIGRTLTDRACLILKRPTSSTFYRPKIEAKKSHGFTLAQKMVGRACSTEAVLPGTYCEPRMTTVGSQDTTGPMTRDELEDLACLGFSADFILQSFCHTVAYPKPVDLETQHTLPDFIINRGGISLRPGDGIIHSWLNRMLLPDTVGTGADSHTRFPIGISFPAGSGLVAFAAATGVMPLDMPESVLVRFTGKLQPGITLRDLVNAIPLYALKMGLLTLEKSGKKNVFSGRILEIEGLSQLKIEQAFEFSDASAERSSTGCTIRLDKEPIIEYLESNVTLMRWMIKEGYQSESTLQRRIKAMEDWLAKPELLVADNNAQYAEIIEINLNDIKEPILACPNDPDNVKVLSEVAGDSVDEVFIGSCMTNIGHYRAAGRLLDAIEADKLAVKLWIVPPTRMDEALLKEEGYYDIFHKKGARTEVPGCSLCMGNQARVAANATVVSTSTRNFPHRLGDNANVYLSSAEVAAVSALLGKVPTVQEYMKYSKALDTMAADVYRYMNFNKIESFQKAASLIQHLEK